MVCLVVENDKIDPKTNQRYKVSKSYVRKFIKANALRPRATAAIDPVRARQATAEVRDRWFQSVEEFVRQLHADGKVSSRRRAAAPPRPPRPLASLAPSPPLALSPRTLAPSPSHLTPRTSHLAARTPRRTSAHLGARTLPHLAASTSPHLALLTPSPFRLAPSHPPPRTSPLAPHRALTHPLQVPDSWTSYGMVPDRCKYNYDEEGANVTKGRPPGLVSDALVGARRVHAICADGRMGKHFTDGFFSRADGKCKSPFAVKACGGQKKKTAAQLKRAQKAKGGKSTGGAEEEECCDSDEDEDEGEELPNILPSDSDGLRDTDAGDGQKACIGLGVTRSGSMVRRLFPALCRHFVQASVRVGVGA